MQVLPAWLRAMQVALHQDCAVPTQPLSKPRAAIPHLQHQWGCPSLLSAAQERSAPLTAQLSLVFTCIFYFYPLSIHACLQRLVEWLFSSTKCLFNTFAAFLLGRVDLCEANLSMSLSVENQLGPHSYSHLPTRSPRPCPHLPSFPPTLTQS